MASGCTPLELFEEVIVQLEGDASVEVIKAESFYKVLVENRIKDDMEPHANLHKMLQLNSGQPDVFSLKNIALVLQAMKQNEQFMNEIENDLKVLEEDEAEGQCEHELTVVRIDEMPEYPQIDRVTPCEMFEKGTDKPSSSEASCASDLSGDSQKRVVRP